MKNEEEEEEGKKFFKNTFRLCLEESNQKFKTDYYTVRELSLNLW